MRQTVTNRRIPPHVRRLIAEQQQRQRERKAERLRHQGVLPSTGQRRASRVRTRQMTDDERARMSGQERP